MAATAHGCYCAWTVGVEDWDGSNSLAQHQPDRVEHARVLANRHHLHRGEPIPPCLRAWGGPGSSGRQDCACGMYAACGVPRRRASAAATLAASHAVCSRCACVRARSRSLVSKARIESCTRRAQSGRQYAGGAVGGGWLASRTVSAPAHSPMPSLSSEVEKSSRSAGAPRRESSRRNRTTSVCVSSRTSCRPPVDARAGGTSVCGCVEERRPPVAAERGPSRATRDWHA